MDNNEAIEWLKAIKVTHIHGGDEEYDKLRKEAIDLAIKALEERPQGEWVDTASGYKCSVCGEPNDYAYDEYKHKFTDYYCPNCGADMRGEEK